MSVRLFVGNLPYDTTEMDLRDFFASVGPLSTVIIPVDRETGKRRGFAFVEFGDPAQAAEASRRLNNQPFKGRNITINEARAKESRPDSGPGARPAYAMRPAGISRTPRPGFAPRPMGGSEFAPDQLESGRTGRAERRSRNFGPDARPSRKRKPHFEAKGEMGWKKGPLRERAGGRLFGGLDDGDDPGDESDVDYLSNFRDTDEEDAV
jgi:RNA recognition motif-containing protein